MAKRKRPDDSKLKFKVTTLVPLGQEKLYDDDSFSLPQIQRGANAKKSNVGFSDYVAVAGSAPSEAHPQSQVNHYQSHKDSNLDSILSKRGSGFEAFTRIEDASPLSQRPMLLTEEYDTFDNRNKPQHGSDKQPVSQMMKRISVKVETANLDEKS